MSNYQRWQMEKFGNALPETDPQELEWENMNIESTEACEWLEKESQLIENQ